METAASATSVPSSTSGETTSSSGINIGAIIGGVLGGLALVAIILLLIIILQRQRPRKPEGAALSSTMNPQAAPPGTTGIQARPGYGKVELENTDMEIIPTAMTEGVQANEKQMGTVERMSGYGLHTGELDANGRYVGELHGDGRNLSYVQAELSGNNGFRVQDPYPYPYQ